MDSSFPIEAQVVNKGYADPGQPPAPDIMGPGHSLPGKGDEVELWLHSGAYVIVRELPPK